MPSILHTAWLDISESVRTKWFALYALVFGGLIAVLFIFGLTESRVMGFTGLSRMLVTFIQLTMAILPIFVLLSTVRSLVGDREAGVYEYMLAFPVSLAGWYWGRFSGRFLVVFIPVFAAMAISLIVGLFMGAEEIPWRDFAWYSALLVSLAFCFLGISFLVSALTRSSDVAQSVAFFLWLLMLMFLDLILIGLLIQFQTPAGIVVGLALTNPLEVFRIGAMMLFDPQLILLGPAAYIILDLFGYYGFMAYALLYPLVLGFVLAGIGYWVFKRTDLP
ncbi:ABC transporter permease [Thermopetrobacter sp. TC1]|uniref:ABC transporter permease n=1 Tax=Thermopetrobacter sp. TC1 TaxID=1495045 RepID=UPI000571F3CB|nr:ABC transporter permease subunit [Thermopetrobacter sp. TC1]